MSQTYRADIDGLRAIAVLAVVVNHARPGLLPGGFVGVDVFFVISGFLITQILTRELSAGTFSFARFYERRARRLFAPLFVVLIAVAVAGWALLLPSDVEAMMRGNIATLLFSANVLFWRTYQEGYFAPDARVNPLLHMWSLGVEEQFYLGYPLLLIALHRWLPRLRFAVVAVLSVASLALAAVFLRGHSVAVFFLSPFRAWELMAGGLLAWRASEAPLRGREFLGWLGLASIVASLVFIDETMPFPGLTALPPVLGTLAMIAAGPTSRANRLISVPAATWVGRISYSLYLWHWPAFIFVTYLFGTLTVARYWPLAVGGAIALGAASYYLVETPTRHVRWSTRTVLGASSATLVILGAFFAFLGDPAHRRTAFPERVLALDKARSPAIPFKACDGREDYCRIGAASAPPTYVLWGDSHALAWAPAFDALLTEQGRAAYLVVHSSCPPLVGMSAKRPESCRHSNEALLDFLARHPELEHVVMAARWGAAFGYDPWTLDGHLAAPVEGNALQHTLQRLVGRHVIVLGPVPIYPDSVPLSLALAELGFREPPSLGREDHLRSHRAFFDAVAGHLGPRQTMIDPSDWLCRPTCTVQTDRLLYRDAEHLNVDGALLWKAELAKAVLEAG